MMIPRAALSAISMDSQDPEARPARKFKAALRESKAASSEPESKAASSDLQCRCEDELHGFGIVSLQIAWVALKVE